MKDRIHRMVKGHITDQMGQPITGSPVSPVLLENLVTHFLSKQTYPD